MKQMLMQNDRKKLDLSLLRFGRLIAWKCIGRGKSNKIFWKCFCDCGKSHIVSTHDLRRGQIKSCGCLRRECAKQRNNFVKHGYYIGGPTPEIICWMGMHRRCYNSNDKTYKYYGGRGINICERWHRDNPDGFKNFLNDIGKRPSKAYSIDRINVNKNYSPDNCRWATKKEQRNNQRAKFIENFSNDELIVECKKKRIILIFYV